MIGQYRGKRLFAGRLFAGRLFGPAASPIFSGGSTRRVRLAPRYIDNFEARVIDEDDTLLLLAAALCAGAGRLQ